MVSVRGRCIMQYIAVSGCRELLAPCNGYYKLRTLWVNRKPCWMLEGELGEAVSLFADKHGWWFIGVKTNVTFSRAMVYSYGDLELPELTGATWKESEGEPDPVTTAVAWIKVPGLNITASAPPEAGFVLFGTGG
jgi:hypothetical protein